MPGVRIHHISEHSCILLVPHPGEIKQGLFKKPLNKGRKAKNYPIHLDSEGNSIVSETVWGRIREAGYEKKFLILNEVAEPPTLYIDSSKQIANPAVKKQIQDAIESVAPPGTIGHVRGYNG